MKKNNLNNSSFALPCASQRLLEAAGLNVAEVMAKYGVTLSGLSGRAVEENRRVYGANQIARQKKQSLFTRLFGAFISPFTIVLLVLAVISLFTDVVIVAANERDFSSVIIVTTMVILSGGLRFVQESRSNRSAQSLTAMVENTVSVVREGLGREEILLDQVVVGDIIYLSAGDMLPADVRVLQAKDLFVSQASLTGESEPIEKCPQSPRACQSPMEADNLAFMGSNVISGTAVCLVLAVGHATVFGSMAKSINEKKAMTGFEKGVASVSWLLIRFMLCMTPVVLFLNGFTKGDWLQAFLFAISVAVGLTPEMLPMIVTTNLAKGALNMSKKKTVIKDLNSIQNLGAMDVLCADKTGTLTQDNVVLERHLDIHGNEDDRVLRHAFLNSFHQTGLKNLMDVAILRHAADRQIVDLCEKYHKVDEIPFDFSRRRMSVVVADANAKTQFITKGAVEEMLSISSYAEYQGKVEPLTNDIRQEIFATVKQLNSQGMRVIAVAQKTVEPVDGGFSAADECDMVLMGYLAFLDPPKETAKAAITALKEYGVSVKVLTGDNDAVTRYICSRVGMKVDNLLLGSDIEAMDDESLACAVEESNVFAKLSPLQKARIVTAMRKNGHTVGFMGDGINDAAAMKQADVGLSVDTAVDIAKASADIILLEKDLMVLEQGVIEGRRTFGNIIKYIKITASSNFGNMLSVVAASAFLPFLPMLPIQILVLNLIYDLSCISIPWDNMDEEYLKVPRAWDASSIGRFMLWMGPASSVFDIATYLLMFFIIAPAICKGAYGTPGVDTAVFAAVFHAGWFVESLWSQTLVIHTLRTPKFPFIKSRASLTVILITSLSILIGTVLPYSPVGKAIGLSALPMVYFLWLGAIIVGYMLLATALKHGYIKRHGELL